MAGIELFTLIVFGLFTALAVYTFQENLKYLLLAEFVILITYSVIVQFISGFISSDRPD